MRSALVEFGAATEAIEQSKDRNKTQACYFTSSYANPASGDNRVYLVHEIHARASQNGVYGGAVAT